LLLLQESKILSGDMSKELADDWVGMEWGSFGGPAAREVCLWVQLQREFRRRSLLPAVAVRRLDAIGFQWETQVFCRTFLPLTILNTSYGSTTACTVRVSACLTPNQHASCSRMASTILCGGWGLEGCLF
jgi:hypothetical protein